MNAKGVEALTKAAMDGVRQIKGAFADSEGGLCAVGVLATAAGLKVCPAAVDRERVASLYELADMTRCPECGHGYAFGASLVEHLNDDHGIDFLGIARKLGPDA